MSKNQKRNKSKGGIDLIEPNMFMSRLAEQAERYVDMFQYLQSVVRSRKDPAHFT